MQAFSANGGATADGSAVTPLLSAMSELPGAPPSLHRSVAQAICRGCSVGPGGQGLLRCATAAVDWRVRQLLAPQQQQGAAHGAASDAGHRLLAAMQAARGVVLATTSQNLAEVAATCGRLLGAVLQLLRHCGGGGEGGVACLKFLRDAAETLVPLMEPSAQAGVLANG